MYELFIQANVHWQQ